MKNPVFTDVFDFVQLNFSTWTENSEGKAPTCCRAGNIVLKGHENDSSFRRYLEGKGKIEWIRALLNSTSGKYCKVCPQI